MLAGNFQDEVMKHFSVNSSDERSIHGLWLRVLVVGLNNFHVVDILLHSETLKVLPPPPPKKKNKEKNTIICVTGVWEYVTEIQWVGDI